MNDALGRLSSALADRYRVEGELGAGGMATVFLAHDIRHDRQVALKVLRPELAAVIGAERFLAEIRTTANLQHPHILPLFESGTADGFVYYVMPLVQGETLRERLNREKQLPVADAVRIGTEVAAALDYAHRHGVIHRDIKPENILLHDGSALVADFGIALAASRAGESRMTETGMSLGTPHYMSPEQALGEREITAASDVYALGCVVYEMLLGEPPFTGPTAQSIVAKVMSEKPASLAARRARIPMEVEDAVLTALEKLPADRFASASGFAAALGAPAAAGRARPPGSQASRRLDWRVAALAGLLVGAGVTAAAFSGTTEASAPTAGARSQLTFNGRSGRPAISPNGEYVAYVDEECPRGLLNPCSATLFVQGRGSDRAVAILTDVPELSAPRFTSDGRSVVVSAALDSARSGLFVIPRLGGVPRRIGPAGVFDTHARADSVLLVPRTAFGRGGMAFVIAVESGTIADSIALPHGSADAIGWSPDGEMLAVVELYTRLTLVRRDGSVADSHRGPFRATVRWSTDGGGILVFRALPVKEDDLAYYAVDGDGRLADAPVVRVAAIQTLLRGEFDIARGTGELVLASGSATWDLWTVELDPRAGLPRRRTSGTTWYGMPSISPDGSRLFYVRGDAIGDNLYMLTLPDTEEALTAEPDPGASAARVSRDGQRVLFGHSVASGMRLGSIDLPSREVTFVDAEGFDTDSPPSFGSDGVVFMTTEGDGLWRLSPSGSRDRVLPAPDSIRVHGFVLNPAADSAALITLSDRGRSLGVTPLDRWAPRWLHHFGAGEFSGHLSWDSSGQIYFSLWKAGEDAPGLWQVGPGPTAAALRMMLPAVCNTGHFEIATDAPRGVCVSEDARSDIWRVDLAGVRP